MLQKVWRSHSPYGNSLLQSWEKKMRGRVLCLQMDSDALCDSLYKCGAVSFISLPSQRDYNSVQLLFLLYFLRATIFFEPYSKSFSAKKQGYGYKKCYNFSHIRYNETRVSYSEWIFTYHCRNNHYLCSVILRAEHQKAINKRIFIGQLNSESFS